MPINVRAAYDRAMAEKPELHSGARLAAKLNAKIIMIFFFQAEDGIRDKLVTGFQTCALPISDVLDLHKTVLDAARREYERGHGRLRNTEFLSVLIEDPAFAWLNPLTALIVRIDEA